LTSKIFIEDEGLNESISMQNTYLDCLTTICLLKTQAKLLILKNFQNIDF
jgi:hypothetical protein